MAIPEDLDRPPKFAGMTGDFTFLLTYFDLTGQRIGVGTLRRRRHRISGEVREPDGGTRGLPNMADALAAVRGLRDSGDGLPNLGAETSRHVIAVVTCDRTSVPVVLLPWDRAYGEKLEAGL